MWSQTFCWLHHGFKHEPRVSDGPCLCVIQVLSTPERWSESVLQKQREAPAHNLFWRPPPYAVFPRASHWIFFNTPPMTFVAALCVRFHITSHSFCQHHAVYKKTKEFVPNSKTGWFQFPENHDRSLKSRLFIKSNPSHRFYFGHVLLARTRILSFPQMFLHLFVCWRTFVNQSFAVQYVYLNK